MEELSKKMLEGYAEEKPEKFLKQNAQEIIGKQFEDIPEQTSGGISKVISVRFTGNNARGSFKKKCRKFT